MAALPEGSPGSRSGLLCPPGGQRGRARVRVGSRPMAGTQLPVVRMTRPIRADTCLPAAHFPTISLPSIHSQVCPMRPTHLQHMRGDKFGGNYYNTHEVEVGRRCPPPIITPSITCCRWPQVPLQTPFQASSCLCTSILPSNSLQWRLGITKINYSKKKLRQTGIRIKTTDNSYRQVILPREFQIIKEE